MAVLKVLWRLVLFHHSKKILGSAPAWGFLCVWSFHVMVLWLSPRVQRQRMTAGIAPKIFPLR